MKGARVGEADSCGARRGQKRGQRVKKEIGIKAKAGEDYYNYKIIVKRY